ncbi:hypothetical protein AB0M23_06610 [Streptomyces sp. NPDC052077]|uniref:hypothetical protein n=1 Tax=Streptomyces sp. NPDC052077 TaxID=3154757 RepID=UPI0034225E70
MSVTQDQSTAGTAQGPATPDDAAVAALLDAGAVLPSGSSTGEDADVLTVRTYTHPALGDRRVVRLVPGTLGEAEDLALDFLGLTREQESPEVGQVRRETLGFPAWALVNDPANGHHALALVKDVERLARQAKSRPGTAKEGFEALGDRLGRAVPHFLPTFYEQAARVFLEHDNSTYAAAFFGKARDAERVHALTVDEERQRAVFLEFAFAGALTVKALKQHVRDLSGRLRAEDAWTQFRQLTVERCAAGMPPYASLPQDARALIKAAGLDRAGAEGDLVADLLASPAAVRAPESFWTAYRGVLPALAARRPEVRARLLEIMPAALDRDGKADEFWLELLVECGADRLLTGEDGTAADGQGNLLEVDAAAWLTRWATHRKHGGFQSDRSPATLALVARMAPRLRADGRPVDLFSGRWRAGADLDLLDLCAAERIPLTLPEPGADIRLSLDRWVRDNPPGHRDLTASAADPRLRPMLLDAVGGAGRDRDTSRVLKHLAGHPVLGDVLREWLDSTVARLTGAVGLPDARATLNLLAPYRAVAAAVNPEAVARVAAYATAPVLGRTLRAGIMDELHWPALEQALGRLHAEAPPKDNDNTLIVNEAWPNLIVSRGRKAIVVGPDGILLDHDLRLPADLDRWQRPQFRYTDGELLVLWWKDGKQQGYWSTRPTEVVALTGEQVAYRRFDTDAPSFPLAAGGRATGGRALHAGDTVLPASRSVLSDGTLHWRQGYQGKRPLWLEYDPATGTHGRASLPAFLRSGVQDDTTLLQDRCEMLPLLPGLEGSPFGTDGTVLGRWVRSEDTGGEQRTTTGTPDGRTVTVVSSGQRLVPLGALRMPGGAEPVVVLRRRDIRLLAPGEEGGELGSVTPGEEGGSYAGGTRMVPPVAFWHALRPRDEEASAVLRALGDERAAELLTEAARALEERRELVAAAKASAAARKDGARDPESADKGGVPGAEATLRSAVSRTLPELSDKRLVAGVASLVNLALQAAGSAATFATPPAERPQQERKRTEGMFADYRPEHGDDRTLLSAVAGMTSLWGGYRSDNQWYTLRQIRAVNHVLSGGPADGVPLPGQARHTASSDGWVSDDHTAPRAGVPWPVLLPALRGLVVRAASPTLPPAEREGLVLLFEALAEGPLAAPGGVLREIELSEPHDRQQRAGQVLRRGGRTVVVLDSERIDYRTDRVHWQAVEYDPEGRFGAVAHFALEREIRFTTVLPDGGPAVAARLLREKGAIPWQDTAPAALAAETGDAVGRLQATVLLAGQPEKLTPEALALVGLKPRQLDAAREMLDTLTVGERTELVGALLPEETAGLWTDGPDLARAGRVWAERHGSLVRVPEELAVGLDGLSLGSAEAVLNPARTAWLSRTTSQRPDEDGDLVAADPLAIPAGSTVEQAVAALATLAYALPYGHPMRSALPEGLAALRRRFEDPGLLLDMGIGWTEKGGSTSVEIRKAYGLPATGGADADGTTWAGAAFALRPWYGDHESVLIRPSALTGPDDPALGLLDGLLGAGHAAPRALRAVLGDGLADAVAAGRPGSGGPTGVPQDPTVSVPELVTEVASAHGLGEDAAALYLQLLALPDPTDRNCARWTGWRPARLKKARAELAASGLVVEAKRTRAGRTLFLPCGWHDLRSPALPVEMWKEGLYPIATGRRTVPALPVPELFARAWARVRAGDAPSYEQLVTRATRKGRRR